MEAFHVKHLTDDEMRELNPIVRNAIYTGLQALKHYDESKGSRSFVDYQKRLIPNYWEPPELLTGFVKTVKTNDDGRRKKALWQSEQEVTPHSSPSLVPVLRNKGPSNRRAFCFSKA